MLRDALYRLEEHCINFPEKCSEDNYWQRFDTIVKTVTNLQKEISKQKQEDAKKVENEKEKLKYFSKLSDDDKTKYNLKN